MPDDTETTGPTDSDGPLTHKALKDELAAKIKPEFKRGDRVQVNPTSAEAPYDFKPYEAQFEKYAGDTGGRMVAHVLSPGGRRFIYADQLEKLPDDPSRNP